MQRFWPYIFFVLICGALGLYVGHASRSEEISLLKQLLTSVPSTLEKHIFLVKVDSDALESELVQKIDPSGQLDGNDYMKQIAHVAPQDICQADVSKSSQDKVAELKQAYKKHLEEACSVLHLINHKERPVRMAARLELAQLRIAGPLGNYMQELINNLLVRYCDDEGKLVQTDRDQAVAEDVLKAIALLEAEIEREQVDTLSRQEFSPVQRRVQRHAYNATIKKMMAA